MVPHGGHSLDEVADLAAEISSAAVKRRRSWRGILGRKKWVQRVVVGETE